MIGYALTGSFCTVRRSLAAMRALAMRGEEIQPFFSERVFSTDTRFYKASDLIRDVEDICGRSVVHTVEDAEPYGPHPLDALIIAPCTGNTLSKIARGITDGAVTMVAKAHLRTDGRILLAPASNDLISQNLSSLATLVTHRSVYILPMLQDDPIKKPYSLISEMERIVEGYDAMMRGERLRPIFK
ncbi:MAG: dipicolinate synthase subunit B [Clostridia bacterium]|nr:dipicolinate synthase subunit B [Clostridia bacterium]